MYLVRNNNLHVTVSQPRCLFSMLSPEKSPNKSLLGVKTDHQRSQGEDGSLDTSKTSSVDTNAPLIGSDHQADIPPLQKKPCRREDATCIWRPDDCIANAELDEFITLACSKYEYTIEQALGVLMYHKHNISTALEDVPNYLPYPDQWSTEDRVIFEQAFNFHGKNFRRIKQMLPDKSIGGLVRFYYSWKKSRNLRSVTDRTADRMKYFDDSDYEDVQADFAESETCVACGSDKAVMQVAPRGALCAKCLSVWKTTGRLSPTESSSSGGKGGAKDKKKRQPMFNPSEFTTVKGKFKPKNINLALEDLELFIAAEEGDSSVLDDVDKRVEQLRAQCQTNKQIIDQLQTKVADDGDCAPSASDEQRRKPTAKWNQQEMMLAVQGFRRYGKQFRVIADIVGNKNELHVRQFYHTYKDQYGLEAVIQEYEDEQKLLKSKASPVVELDEEPME